MTLYEYVTKYVTNKQHFAVKLKISESALYKYLSLEREPKLAIAIRINKVSGGLISFEEMLANPMDASLELSDHDLL